MVALVSFVACLSVAAVGYLLTASTDASVPESWSMPAGAEVTSFEGLMQEGLAAYGSGDLVEAKAAFEAALALDPASDSALFNVAIAAAGLGDTATAEASYRAIIARSPQEASSYWNLGLLLYRNGDVTQGRDLLRTALALDPALASRLPDDVDVE